MRNKIVNSSKPTSKRKRPQKQPTLVNKHCNRSTKSNIYGRTHTFSNCIGFILNPGGNFLAQSSNLAMRFSIMAVSSMEAVERLVAFSSVTILTPCFGWNSGTSTLSTAAANFFGFLAQSGMGIPNTSALNIEPANIKLRWLGSLDANCNGRGKRLGADQNGAPELVIESSGKVNVSCFTRLEK